MVTALLMGVRLSFPLGLKQKLYPQIPLGGGGVQLSIFWSLALNRNRRNLHAPYRPGILNVLIHLKHILTSHTRFSQLLLMLPSRFSRVRLCGTLWTAAHQAPVHGILQAPQPAPTTAILVLCKHWHI